jgi:hypothetical protein
MKYLNVCPLFSMQKKYCLQKTVVVEITDKNKPEEDRSDREESKTK